LKEVINWNICFSFSHTKEIRKGISWKSNGIRWTLRIFDW